MMISQTRIMFISRISLFLIILALARCAGRDAAAQTTNVTNNLDFSTFKIITDRNIFNPRRSARYTPRTETRRATPRVESFALLGTMSYEKGPFAFFDGTSSDYRKAVKPDETIAGYKVTGIEPAFVKLRSPTNEMELRVGMQLSREEGGAWRMEPRPESQLAAVERPSLVRPPAPTPAPQTETPAGPGGEPPIIIVDPNSPLILTNPQIENGGTNVAPGVLPAGAENEVLRRLMQRREQENNQ